MQDKVQQSTSIGRRFKQSWVNLRKPGDRAVSNVIGDVLLVGMTVAGAGALVFAISNLPTPDDTLHSALSMRADSGMDGVWGTGDERITLRVTWGDGLPKQDTQIRVDVSGTVTVFEGDDLDQGFDGGFLEVGGVWSGTITIEKEDDVLIEVISASYNQLVAGQKILAGELPADPCADDVAAPTVFTWVQAPPNIDGATTGPVTITATLLDNCSGPDDAVAPHLFWAINAGAPVVYNDAGAMSLIGSHKWRLDVPAQPWNTHVGEKLWYYLDPLTDRASNEGASITRSDLIDIFTLKTYVASSTPTLGTVTNFANAQDANDAGAEAEYIEGQTTSGGETDVHVHTWGSKREGSVGNQNRIKTSDNQDGRYNSASDWLEMYNWDVNPNDVDVITKVEIGFEGANRQSSPSNDDPIMRLRYRIGTSAPWSAAEVTGTLVDSTPDATFELDITSLETWTEALVAQSEIRLDATQMGDHAEIDHAYIRVTSTRPSNVTYAMDIQSDITGVPSGSSQSLELLYRVTNEDFELSVWDWVASDWNIRAQTLGSLTSTIWTDTLAADEVSGTGAVRIVFQERDPDSATQGTLFADYIRVVTAP